jgi:hypothetical protein
VSINATIAEGINHPARPELIHTKTVTLIPESPLNTSSTPGMASVYDPGRSRAWSAIARVIAWRIHQVA